MSVTVRVVAPYVTLRVKALSGEVVQGYYAPAVVEAAEGEVLDRHLARGLVEAVEAEPAESADGGVEMQPLGPERPHGNAGRDAWATYAVESGQASEDDVKDLSRDELRELYG